MTTLVAQSPRSLAPVNPQDAAWAAEVLKADDLKLSEERAETYGRASLGVFAKILLWGMRVYVALSFVLIATQLYISLRH